jgi:4-alpha-glucanotransferase
VSLFTRSAGILLHVSSLPGPYGIGDLGPTARRWIDLLARARQSWWQILPLGYGGSPYHSLSAFAGSARLISPELLIEEGLLNRGDVRPPRFAADSVDYPAVAKFKDVLLRRARGRFRKTDSLEKFSKENTDWLDDFALLLALRTAHGGRPWFEWPRPLMMRQPEALREARRVLADEIDYHRFVQFIFFKQLAGLRKYAASRGVRIIGDLPIFVSGNSADVWLKPELFRLDKNRRPTVVSGVPPDAFSRTGQRWGNPLYNWPAMKRDGFAWWIARFQSALRQADVVRIDHFRGFAACWEIPASAPTAQRGRWVKSPGRELFAALRASLGQELPLIAEDLGTITPDVEALRDELGVPGMRVLQFAFSGGPANPYLPHNYERKTFAYTGTHDNNTTLGWFKSLATKQKRSVRRYVGDHAQRDITSAMVRLVWSSVADCAIAPLQDALGLDSRARMNIPGTTDGNWKWRVRQEQLTADVVRRLAEMTRDYARSR